MGPIPASQTATSIAFIEEGDGEVLRIAMAGRHGLSLLEDGDEIGRMEVDFEVTDASSSPGLRYAVLHG